MRSNAVVHVGSSSGRGGGARAPYERVPRPTLTPTYASPDGPIGSVRIRTGPARARISPRKRWFRAFSAVNHPTCGAVRCGIERCDRGWDVRPPLTWDESGTHAARCRGCERGHRRSISAKEAAADDVGGVGTAAGRGTSDGAKSITPSLRAPGLVLRRHRLPAR